MPGFCQVEHPSEEEDTSTYQSPMQTLNRRNKKSTTQRDISSMSQTTQIELEQKYCIFHILGIQNAPWLVSAMSNTPLRRKTQAPASHRCKTSTEEIRSQQPKGKYSRNVASFKAWFRDDDGDYGLTPTYTMGISLCRDALCWSKLYIGWVNEEDKYVQGRGGEGCSTWQKTVKVHSEYLDYGIYNPLVWVRSV